MGFCIEGKTNNGPFSPSSRASRLRAANDCKLFQNSAFHGHLRPHWTADIALQTEKNFNEWV